MTDKAKAMVSEGEVLARFDQAIAKSSNLAAFMDWLNRNIGSQFENYDQLWKFSVENLERFWTLWWAFIDPAFGQSDLGRSGISNIGFDPTLVLDSRDQPASGFFKGQRCNYASYSLARCDDAIAIVVVSELNEAKVTFRELNALVAAFSKRLRDRGVRAGDGVVGYLPNSLEALVAFLAAASIGAIWSSCSPDFGSSAVADRFIQLKPKVLVAVSSYSYGGKVYDRTSEVRDICGALGANLELLIVDHTESFVENSAGVFATAEFMEPIEGLDRPQFEDLDFNHPLWVLYSSGTTGMPKAIVHSHGGIFLEHTKALSLHCDIREGDLFFWFTTTGWMMWNFLISGLLVGSGILLFDGSPGYKDLYRLFDIAASKKVTFLGVGAPFVTSCQKANITPKQRYDLRGLRTIGSTGAPLSPEGFSWIYENVADGVAVASVSGGTDLCTAFLLSTPFHDTKAGVLNVAGLGAFVIAANSEGQGVVDEVGELVIVDPMPSMPIYFLNDPSGEKLHDAYFSTYPNMWRHGDWVKERSDGSFVIYGRSDSTLNRGGVRMGTADFYRVIEMIPMIVDSMIIDTSRLGNEGKLVLLVVIEAGGVFTDGLGSEIRTRIREELSPRHVPDLIVEVSAIPRTLNGKKMEVPIRRLLLGEEIDKVASRGSMANPDLILEYQDLKDRL